MSSTWRSSGDPRPSLLLLRWGGVDTVCWVGGVVLCGATVNWLWFAFPAVFLVGLAIGGYVVWFINDRWTRHLMDNSTLFSEWEGMEHTDPYLSKQR